MKLLYTLLIIGFFTVQQGIAQTLNKEQIAIVQIASYTSLGNLEGLETALESGLENGLSINQIKEVLVHSYAYCGFPRSISGLRTFIAVLEDRKAKGITDEQESEASPIVDEQSKYEQGKEVLGQLLNTSLDGPKADYAQFAPQIDTLLKEHLFADLFKRDVLTYQQRELATVSILVSIGNVEPMLKSHMNICIIQGIKTEQLKELLAITKKIVGKKKTKSAGKVLNEILESKK